MRRIIAYIYQQPKWPSLAWDSQAIMAPLGLVRHRQGRLLGQMQHLGFQLRDEAVLLTLTEEAVKSSEIEGDRVDREGVRSSIARRLGIAHGGLKPTDRHVEGIAEMLVDATGKYKEPLTKERLFGWHASLFPTGRSGMRKIRVGMWREDKEGPMRVISEGIRRVRVHFEAPAAERVKKEMESFLNWFNRVPDIDPVLKAGIAHLWFVTIHPFDDGNGRIARAIADLCLARSEKSSQRFYSMSAQIRKERKAYYDMLEKTQKGSLDITPWLTWFLGCLSRAIDGAETLLESVLAKERFWNTFGKEPVNERQRKMLNQLFDGFEGRLTATKWAKLTRSSPDTALRDITELVDRRILVRSLEGGRSTSYTLALQKKVRQSKSGIQ